MAEKRVYTAELRDMFTGRMMTYQVELVLNSVGIESVVIIDPDGAREKCKPTGSTIDRVDR